MRHLLLGLLIISMTACAQQQAFVRESASGALAKALPAVESLRKASFAAGPLGQSGSAFDPAYVQHVSSEADGDALFNPAFNPADPHFSDLAYAIYRFDVTNFDRQDVLGTAWETNDPLHHPFVGVANWATNRWDMFEVPDDGRVSFPIATYANAGNEIVVVVILQGNSPQTLKRIALGNAGGWTRSWGTADGEYVFDMGIDNQDNSYLYGQGGPSSNFNVLFLKYSPDGGLDWVKTLDKPAFKEEARCFAVNPQGEVAFGIEDNPGFTDPRNAVIGKLTGDGELAWLKRWETTNEKAALSAIGWAPNGTLLVVGSSYDNVSSTQRGAVLWMDADGNPLSQYLLDDCVFLNGPLMFEPDSSAYAEFYDGTTYGRIKLAADGEPTAADTARVGVLGPGGNVWIADQTQFDDVANMEQYTLAGQPVWQTNVDTPDSDYTGSATLDAAGQCYASGYISTASSIEPFVCKFAADGQLQHAFVWDGSGGAQGNADALDSQGSLMVCLSLMGSGTSGNWQAINPTATSQSVSPLTIDPMNYSVYTYSRNFSDASADYVLATPIGTQDSFAGGTADVAISKIDRVELQ